MGQVHLRAPPPESWYWSERGELRGDYSAAAQPGINVMRPAPACAASLMGEAGTHTEAAASRVERFVEVVMDVFLGGGDGGGSSGGGGCCL
ncbi:hypothetical protein E2C01_088049 [Portunus trituberculatus]|uniref:Uncharacterized protein n=1 Tax=Portunus trituberculatus TaxID=210409 RepID=A0A5B7JFN3_PORTR|nr:hypothetical protein [Portunus trituberculatus]